MAPLLQRAGGLALVFASTRSSLSQHTANAVTAIQTLQGWYNATDGLWNSTGWWNSANCLTTLADFAVLDPTDASKLSLGSIFSNTYTNAQKVAQVATKAVDTDSFMVTSSYARVDLSASDLAARDGYAGFINTYYDDEGWWALALLRAYDATGDALYLGSAQSIYADMQTGASADCGGGIWWSKDRKYKNAIANELYLAVAAGLANRANSSSARDTYRAAAAAQWSWFRSSGMFNANGTINDGLSIAADGTCSNNNQTVWSYNQGVVLGGLVELHRAQNGSDASLLPAAAAIAKAAMAALSTDGILHDPCEAANSCGGDGSTFKGVFVRNLHYLYKQGGIDSTISASIRSFILQNADSIWKNDRATNGQLGLIWSGPPTAADGPNAGTHDSALDALVAAVAVA